MSNSHKKDARIINNDYVILFDENGQPYIAHGVFSNAKERAHKYIQKIKDSKGWRYFYSEDEWEAYQRARNATAQAYRDLGMTKKAISQPIKTTVKRNQKSTYSPYSDEFKDYAVKKAEYNLADKQAQELEAEKAYRKTLRGKVDLMRAELRERLRKREHERVVKQAQKQREKDKQAQEKLVASDSKHYAYRKDARFQNGHKAKWNSDSVNSSYNIKSLTNAVDNALKQDNVKPYAGKDQKILKAQKTVRDRRTQYEEHAIDLKIAQKELDKLKQQEIKAKKAFKAVADDPTSSREAYKAAEDTKDAMEVAVINAKNDIQYITELMKEDYSAYKSAIQIYNTYFHVYNT